MFFTSFRFHVKIFHELPQLRIITSSEFPLKICFLNYNDLECCHLVKHFDVQNTQGTLSTCFTDLVDVELSFKAIERVGNRNWRAKVEDRRERKLISVQVMRGGDDQDLSRTSGFLKTSSLSSALAKHCSVLNL